MLLKNTIRGGHQGILWLASYPKSGNTWFRAFLTALIHGEININELTLDTHFASRVIFDEITDLDSRLLTETEVKRLMPEVMRAFVKERKGLQFVKIHDSYTLNSEREPIVPADSSYKILYLVRNPLDIVPSFASHESSTIDKMINTINSHKTYLAPQFNGNNTNPQFRQLIGDWSTHVSSWITQTDIETVIVKYEDMVEDPVNVFYNILEQLSLNYTREEVQQALEVCSFDNLRRLENANGFKEKNSNASNFFRKGKVGSWKTELTPGQVEKIINKHKVLMVKFGYL